MDTGRFLVGYEPHLDSFLHRKNHIQTVLEIRQIRILFCYCKSDNRESYVVEFPP